MPVGRADGKNGSMSSAGRPVGQGRRVRPTPPGGRGPARAGLPLTAAVTAANVNDTLLFAALLDDVPAVLIPHHARRLAVRWDRESGRWFGFVLLACALVCFKQL
jgi:hypothetical protein